MEVEEGGAEKRTMVFEEESMESSTSFVTALQELKNLKSHLYSAAEYCEKSYLKSEQQQMILDNLKDYVSRALVNTIDHLGTVAYKLHDIVDQQALEISSFDLKVDCLNQKLLTCRTYTDREGLRQQQLLAIIPSHHKHYTLPNSTSKKVHFGPYIQSDFGQHVQVKSHRYPSGALAARTLSWHLASETKSTFKGPSIGIMSTEESKINGNEKTSGNSKNSWRRSTPATRVAMRTLGVTRILHKNPNPQQKRIMASTTRTKFQTYW
ncbi:protein ABIL1-like isoform X2 [Andrographis paniculata]|uniref:protein ABIL1-like isoform X2 n=1 Tax=Andrographis paniculata TaxID=175694 RepID=UPI0021E98E02|nr:protein ABIL1-like isoform X2 [Andrographis paniculata]